MVRRVEEVGVEVEVGLVVEVQGAREVRGRGGGQGVKCWPP